MKAPFKPRHIPPKPKLEPLAHRLNAAEKFPRELLSVGGIIGDWVQMLVDTAISPQPVLALGAAISLVGTLAGQKYRTSDNLRTNIYAVGIADSGGGKDYARTVIKDALYAAKLADYMGGGKIASGSGLLMSLQRHPCRLFLLDEMGKFVRSVTAARVGAFREEIWTNLTELYTSAGSVYLGTEYANQSERPRLDIVQPCCSIYGVTVPRAFWSALSGGDLSDGSLARFLIFLSDDDYPDRQEGLGVGTIPDHIVHGLQSIVEGVGEPGNLTGIMSDPKPYTVPATPEARELLVKLSNDQLIWLRSKRGTDDTAIVARFAENVKKVALIRAISDCPSSPNITEENVTWGSTLVRHCINILLRETRYHVAETPHEANLNKIMNFIREQAVDGIEVTDTILSRGVRSMDAKTRSAIISEAIRNGTVIQEARDTGGKTKATFYRLVSLH